MFKKGKYFAGWPWFWVLNWTPSSYWGACPSRLMVILSLGVLAWCALMLTIAVLMAGPTWIIVSDIICTVYQLGYYVVRKREREEYLTATSKESADSAD